MRGWSKPNFALTGASSALDHFWSRPFWRFRIVVARSPGMTSWAKNVTEAAAIRTAIAETTLTVARRAARTEFRAGSVGALTEGSTSGARVVMSTSLHEVGVGEDRLALALLHPEVLEVVRHGHEGVLGVEPDAGGVVLDLLLGLLVELRGLGLVGRRVGCLDHLGHPLVVVEGAVVAVRVLRGVRAPDDPEDGRARAGPVRRSRVVRRGIGVLAAPQLGHGGRDQLDVEADLLPLLLQGLQHGGSLGGEDEAGAVDQLDRQRLA